MPQLEAAAALAAAIDGAVDTIRGVFAFAATTKHFPDKKAPGIARESRAEYMVVQRLAGKLQASAESRGGMAKAWTKLERRLGEASSSTPAPTFTQEQLRAAQAEAGARRSVRTGLMCFEVLGLLPVFTGCQTLPVLR